jgi:hypothetical protein
VGVGSEKKRRKEQLRKEDRRGKGWRDGGRDGRIINEGFVLAVSLEI